VVLGGGRVYFLPETAFDPEYSTTRGRRKDGRNLIQQWQNDHPNGKFFHSYEALKAQNLSAIDSLFGNITGSLIMENTIST